MSTLPPRGRSPHLADLPEPRVRLLQLADDIAVRLHALLRERGWSQSDLAGRVGKTKSYVSRVLAGTENVTLKTVAEFEAALGADVLTVPASEPAVPRRRRAAAPAPAAEPATLAEGLPASLRQRVEVAAEAEGTTAEALLTQWVAERLAQPAWPGLLDVTVGTWTRGRTAGSSGAASAGSVLVREGSGFVPAHPDADG